MTDQERDDLDDLLQTLADQQPEREDALLQGLAAEDPGRRGKSLRALASVEEISPQLVRAVEKIALCDPQQALRRQALEVLAAPAVRAVQRTLSPLSLTGRRLILAEVERWEKEGLISPALGELLRGRYALAAPPRAREVKKAAPAGRASLRQVLLGETAVRFALYLGAFFVVAAAFILAAVVEVARLPILTAAMFLFFSAAWGLKARLPLVSYVFFAIGGVMLPIVAGVLMDRLDLAFSERVGYWALAFLLLAGIWWVGAAAYEARLFALLAFGSLDVAVVLAADKYHLAQRDYLLMLMIVAAAVLLNGRNLQRWRAGRFFWPLFFAAHIQLGILLALSGAGLMLGRSFGELPEGGQWLIVGSHWLLAAVAYAASDRFAGRQVYEKLNFSFPLFGLLFVAALTPAPLFFLGALSPSEATVAAVAWVWGLVLTLAAEWQGRKGRALVRGWAPFQQAAGALLFAMAAAMEAGASRPLAILYLGGASAVYLGLMILRPRWGLWMAAIVSGYLAYGAAFVLTDLRELHLFGGYIPLLPMVLLLAIHLAGRARPTLSPAWWQPPLYWTLVVGAINLRHAVILAPQEAGNVVLMLLVYCLLFASYAVVRRAARVGYGSTISLALALAYLLYWRQADGWVMPLVGLAAAYYAVGNLLAGGKALGGWPQVFRLSAMSIGTLVALSAPFQGGPTALLSVAAVAMIFTLEAIRQRNPWLGFPANGLYFLAYVMALSELNVTEPQYYSIAAALLGIIMHYVLQRGGHRTAAFVTGGLAQLILLSTTYIQMIDSGRFLFFFILFFQALVLLAYGLIIRSRSFVIVPAIFAVLGVLGVAFSVLSGVPTALLIGCTGLLLLGLGSAALALREQLARAGETMADRFAGWNP